MSTRARARCCLLSLLPLVIAGCGGAARPPTSGVAAATAPVDGHVRLDRTVVPTRYGLELTIDPGAATFSGHAMIAVDLSVPTARIALHAAGLTFTRAAAVYDDAPVTLEVEVGTNGGIALVAAEPIGPGAAVLDLEYTAPLADAPEGAFRVRHEDRWYVFTQLEPLDARRAFPCFDQPEFKTPFDVALKVPAGLEALGNAPEQERATDDGWTTVRLATTRPLPTYLVAFAVGPFDIVTAPPDAASVPLRAIAPHGKGALTGYALAVAPQALGALERFFGTPYPYAKLDLVAIPDFSMAMENVGLVTFAEQLLLIDEERASAAEKLSSLSVIAHELAHMWFGNLVTLAWWDDLWLNEAFATWMEARITHAVDPSLGADLEAGYDTRRVMALDAKQDARAIRQPITGGGDVQNAFDGITYVKGAAVIRMFAAWIGEERFRAGIGAVLAEHADGTLTTEEFLATMERVTGRPLGDLIARFLDQPGTPLLDLDLTCADGRVELAIGQTRFRRAGSAAEVGAPWQVPICVRYGSGETTARECLVLDGPRGTFELKTQGCPEWLHPNADEVGYYRWRLPAERLRALAVEHRDQLTPAERIALANHLAAWLESESITAAGYLDTLREVASGEHRFEVSGAIDALYKIRYGVLDGQELPRFSAYVRELLGPHLARLGTANREGEPTQDRLVRPKLISAFYEMTGDPELARQAREYAARYLEAPTSVDATLAGVWLPIAAATGDRALWDRLRQAAASEQVPGQRDKLVAALGAFRDAELIEASYGLLLDGTLAATDLWPILSSFGTWTEGREVVWRWMTANYQQLSAALGEFAAINLPWLGSAFCSEDDRAKVERFFAELAAKPAGTDRNVGLATEWISQCVRLQTTYRAEVTDYFSAPASSGRTRRAPR